MRNHEVKVAILTQPLGHNYGGLLQAYALQQLLRSLGYQVETIDRLPSPSLRLRTKLAFQHAWAYFTGKAKFLSRKRSQLELNKHLLRFRDQAIKLSPPITNSKALRSYITQGQFAVLVVGSDQVWRPRYSPKLEDYFLSFATDLSNVTKISYAASFGVGDFAVAKNQLAQYASLLATFDAVSVREASGADICREQLHYQDATVVPDPTLYFDGEFYGELAKRSTFKHPEPYILTYLLDETDGRTELAQQLSERASMPLIHLMEEKKSKLASNNSSLLPVEDWLSGFQNADYVVTDSFHGCVFSLLFHKKFIAIGNAARGLDRFDTFLQTFCLKQRLICDGSLSDYDSIYSTLNDTIDWEDIELIRARQNAAALDFIIENFPKLPVDDQINEMSSGSGDD